MLVKEIRRVFGIMQFLGEAGGVYSSIFIVGTFLSFLFSGKDSTLQLLERHFISNDQVFESLNPGRWMQSYRVKSTRLIDKLIFGTSLDLICKCILRRCCPKKDHQRLFMMQVETHLQRSLDIRTMLRSQSVLLAIIRVLFDPLQYPLLALQRKGNMIDLHEDIDTTHQLIYGSE